MTSPALSPALSGPQAPMPIPLPGAQPGPAPSSAQGSFARQLQQAQSAPEADAAARADAGTEARREAAADTKRADGEATDRADAARAAEAADATDTKDSAAAKARALAARWLNLPAAAPGGTAAPGNDAGTEASGTDRTKSGAEPATDGAMPADSAAALIASLLPRTAATPATPAPRADAAEGSVVPGDAGVAGDAAASVRGLESAATQVALTGAEDAAQRHGLALGHDRLAQGQARAAHDPAAGDAALQALRERLSPADDRAQPLTPVQEAGAAAAAAANTAATSTLPGFAAELAKATQTASATASNPAPTAAEVHVATPVMSPEFVPRLTGELAMLARDGVQEARVQVNPVDLGPIAVQITLEGNTAQVHLAVASDQTRQVLEQAMPSLAAALRESGLTLTGGGVFQQARQNGRDTSPDGSGRGTGRGGRGGDGDDGAAAVAAPVRRMRLPGTVDLYA